MDEMDELRRLDLILFAIGTRIKIEPGPVGGSAWAVHTEDGIGFGFGNRIWVAVDECLKDVGRKRDRRPPS